jgi:small-conductance mechanosensitive channel
MDRSPALIDTNEARPYAQPPAPFRHESTTIHANQRQKRKPALPAPLVALNPMNPSTPQAQSETPRTDAPHFQTPEEIIRTLDRMVVELRQKNEHLERELTAAHQQIAKLNAAFDEGIARTLNLEAQIAALQAELTIMHGALYPLYKYEAYRSDSETAWERPMMRNARNAIALFAARTQGAKEGQP